MSNLNTKVLFISCIADKVNSPLYWKKKSKVDVSSSDYVQTLSGTLWTATAQNWNKTFTHIEYRAGAVDQKGLVNVFLLSFFQSSLLLIHFLYCSNTCPQQNQCGTSLLHSRFKCRHVTQRSCSSWGGALRDDTKNGCVADYCGTNLSYMWRSSFRDRRGRSFAPWQKSRRNQMNRSPIRTYPVRQVFAPAPERLSGIASAVAWTQPRFSVVQFICLSAGEGLPT